MSDNTKIEWADATVNAINGCSVVSPGCTNCYAMRLAGTRLKHHPTREGLTIDTKAGPVWSGRVRLHEPALMQPLAWKRPRRIFWNAHGDLFHLAVPDAWIDRVFAVCALTPHHTHMILTKRSARMREYMAGAVGRIADAAIKIRRERGDKLVVVPLPHIRPGAAWWPLPNVWLGVSVEDQQRAEERIPDLLATPAWVRFLSCEPLLGEIDLLQWLDPTGACCGGEPEYRCQNCPSDASWRYSIPSADGNWAFDPTIDWVIVGGESGPGARPMHPDWARSLRDQCAAAGVPFHFKQWGEWAPDSYTIPIADGARDCACGAIEMINPRRAYAGHGRSVTLLSAVGKARAGRLLDGVEHNGLPAVPHA